MFTRGCEFFYAAHCAVFSLPKKGRNMNSVIKNANGDTMGLADVVARVVYAETGARSLRVVEALTSMISNCAKKYGIDICDVISNTTMFESQQNKNVNIDSNARGFQMCVRTAIRMLHGNLPDMCYGATMFHRDDVLPQWAIARGYIADIDGILFYV